MSLWNWFYQASMQSTDELEESFFAQFTMAQQLIGDAPDTAVQQFQRAREIAVELERPDYVLMCDHWIMQCQLRACGDAQKIIQRGIRASVDAQSPACSQVPQRVCIHEDLLFGFIIADPHGYKDKIERAIAFMENEIAPDVECALCLQRCRTRFYLATDQMEQAELSAQRHFNTGFSYHQSRACEHLCAIAYAKKDWEALLGYVHFAETLSSEHERQEVREFLAWKALALQRLGEADAAQSAVFDAVKKPLPGALSTNFYDAVASFFEYADNCESAWETRESELHSIIGKSRTWEECLCRVKRCALLRRMDRQAELQAERRELNQAADQLKQPDFHDWDQMMMRY